LGLFSQTGGAHTAASIAVGSGTNASGAYNLYGGSLSVANDLSVGGLGNGTFTQFGGSASAGGVFVGGGDLFAASGGTYFLYGGTLTSGSLRVGQAGAGTFVQTGGTHVIGTPGDMVPSIVLGDYDEGAGTYILSGSGASLIVNGGEQLNFHGHGTFIQSAGTHRVTGVMDMGDSAGNARFFLSGGSYTVLGGELIDSGPFTQSGGSNTVGTVSANQDLLLGTIGRGGRYELNGNGATLTVYGTERIGDDSNGVFHQSAGRNTASTAVIVGRGTAGRGSYTLSGGALTTPLLSIGGVGSFADTGGTFTYSGGALNVTTLSVAGHMTVTQGSHLTPVVKSLQIDNATAKVDLTDNNLVVDFTGPIGTLVNDTRQDLHDGALFSSVTTVGGHSTRLGYADNALLRQTLFEGQLVDPTSLLIKFTFSGDANLDGQVDTTDLGALASHWQTMSVWTGGDFTYDGFVDVADLGLLASNWQAGNGNPLNPSLDAALASVGLSGIVVPEPAFVARWVMLTLAAGAILSAPRRRAVRAF